ncbi:MAG: hypothetical protein MUP11_11960 [Anaerolineales bacterium]|nr:hypothetical protein [Anaerolineales bacterium]
MKKNTLNRVITIMATLVTIGVNALANILPLNGLNTGEISDRFEIYFVPAGYVFSIWGLIYLGLIVYTVFQALPSQAENSQLQRIAPYYWVGSLANTIWIFLWHYEVFSLTLIAMFAILITLLMINRSLAQSEGATKWLAKLPFSIYLGWISVATIANVSQFLYFYNWSGWGIDASVWAVLMLSVATLLGILMVWRENDLPYLLVLIWAFVGITVSQASAAAVVNAAWVGVVVLALAGLGSVIKNKKIS